MWRTSSAKRKYNNKGGEITATTANLYVDLTKKFLEKIPKNEPKPHK